MHWCAGPGSGNVRRGQARGGGRLASRSIDLSPDFMTSRFDLAAAAMGLGRMAQAREAVRSGLVLNPTFTIARYRASPSSDNPRHLAGPARRLDVLRAAGVPEA